ncbi:PQQ-binding-like beta-propeller repeat protein [Dactylosporangium sp. CA-052675]|uniref:outer membrane protein assembly factor BamB family protein n=1 Tax=Dactylosporangium sp. CA-052675 TaxID=3239927 RepID=UPI003D8C32E1
MLLLAAMSSTLISPPTGAAAAGIGYGSTADADWRQDGGDPGRSGHQALTGPLDAAAAKHLRPAWAAPATRPGEQVGGAIVIDGTVLRASGGPSGQIRRYDAATGHDLGPVVDAPGLAFGPLAAAGDTLLVEAVERPALRRTLRAYTFRGERQWTVDLPDAVSGGFTAAGDLILRAAGDTLTAYRTADGSAAWTAQLGGEPGFRVPVRLGDLVLQGIEPGGITSIGTEPATPGASGVESNGTSGTSGVESNGTNGVESNGTNGTNGVESNGTQPAIAAFDARTGAQVWRRAASGAELVAAGDAVYAVGERGICAYTAADGARRWCDAQTLEAPVHASLGDGALFVVDGHGGLAAFDTGTGAPRWRTSYGLNAEVDASYWAPVNGGGVVYAMVYHFAVRGGVSTHRVELVAADTSTGRLIRRLEVGVDAMRGEEPLLLAGDHVYFAAVQKLHAFSAS